MANDIFPTNFSPLTATPSITLLADNGTGNGTVTIANILGQLATPSLTTLTVSGLTVFNGSISIPSLPTSPPSGSTLWNDGGVVCIGTSTGTGGGGTPVTITSGSIDGTTIGLTTPSSGAFTTLTSTGTSNIAGYLTSATASSTYAPLSSPTFTGSVIIPGGAINNTSIGSTTPLTGSFTSLNLIPTTNSLNLGINITQNIAGTPISSTPNYPNFWANNITLIDDAVNVGANVASAFNITYNYGGSTMQGGRAALTLYSIFNGASSSSNTNHFYVGLTSGAYAYSPDGGTSGTPQGSVFGMNPYSVLRTGATNFANVGCEIDVLCQTGSSVAYKTACSFVLGLNDAVQGSTYDCLIALSAETGGVGTKNGILVGPMNGAFPLASTTSQIIQARYGTFTTGILFNTCVITNGFDFSLSTVSGSLMIGPSSTFTIGNSGIITGTNYKLGGDTANGSVQLGSAGTTATPHVDFSGQSVSPAAGYNFRIWNDAANQLGFYTSNGKVANFKDSGATTANYVSFISAAAGNTPTIGAVGTDSTIGMLFAVPSGTAFGIADVGGTAVNYLQVRGAPTTASVSLLAVGTDSSVGMKFIVKGANTFTFQINGGTTVAQISQTGLGIFNGGVTSTGAMTLQTAVVTSGSTYAVLATDYTIIINKGTGSSTGVTLPSSPATGRTLVIKDGKGDANTNNITISAATGNIDGSATAVINVAYGAMSLVYNGTQWNIISESGTGSIL